MLFVKQGLKAFITKGIRAGDHLMVTASGQGDLDFTTDATLFTIAIATLPAQPGLYQVRTIVREGMKGNLAAATRPVEVRPK